MTMDRRGHRQATSSAPTITWHPTNVRDLQEARLVDEDGSALYAGYIVRRAGDGGDEWHGYIGITHVLVAVGTREVVQAAVERAAREAWTDWVVNVRDHGQHETAYRSDG